MATTISRPEAAYRRYVRHPETCGTCLAGRPCVTAIRLGRAWRESRR